MVSLKIKSPNKFYLYLFFTLRCVCWVKEDGWALGDPIPWKGKVQRKPLLTINTNKYVFWLSFNSGQSSADAATGAAGIAAAATGAAGIAAAATGAAGIAATGAAGIAAAAAGAVAGVAAVAELLRPLFFQSSPLSSLPHFRNGTQQNSLNYILNP